MDPIIRLIEAIDQFDVGLWEQEVLANRGDYFFRTGETNKYAYYIREGAVRAFIDGNGEELTIRFGYKGSFIGSLQSMFHSTPSEISMQALKKTVARKIHIDNLRKVLSSDPNLEVLWRQILEALVIQQIEREIDILTVSPSERYKRVLKRSPQLFQEIPHKYIASYLRMSPETLSRLKKA